MNSEYDKTIYLIGNKIENKEKAISYFKSEFDLPSYTGNTLDAIADSLSEVKDRVEILIIQNWMRF
jgi:RNAse (barnase) inhibitor barstar